jgi:hypothetical protein
MQVTYSNYLFVNLYSLKFLCILFQLIRDFEDTTMVNEQLEKMGHNIGNRSSPYIHLQSNL